MPSQKDKRKRDPVNGKSPGAAKRIELKTLKESEERYRRLVEMCPDAIAVHSEGKLLFLNPAGLHLMGARRAEQVVGRPLLDFVHPEWRRMVEKRVKAMIQEGRMEPLMEEKFLRLDGTVMDVEAAASPFFYEGKRAVQVIFRDVTRRKQTEARLLHMERLLRCIRAINQLIGRVPDPVTLLQAACRSLAETGEYLFVWIGLLDADHQKIVPMAKAGRDEGYMDEIVIPWDSRPTGRGPAGTALRTQTPWVAQDGWKDFRFQPWKDAALKRGFNSAAAVPILADGNPYGVLNVFAARPGIFHEQEVDLLSELAADLGFALKSLESDALRLRAEGSLRESESRMKGILASMDDLVFALDRETRFTFFHAPREESLLMPPTRFLGEKCADVMPPHFQELFRKAWKGVQKGKAADFEYWLELEGTLRWFSVKLSPLHHKDVFEGAVAVVREITERIRSEEERLQSLKRLEKNLEATVQALATAMEQRDPSTAGHQSRTSRIACGIARELGLPLERIEGLRIAAMVHDIGKITVPAEILSKPGKLFPVEMAIVQTHPQTGYEILKGIAFPWPVAEIVLQHQERVDGTGYPRHLHRSQILLEARILAVADTVDAMASHRPYRPAHDTGATLREIVKFKGTYYDPDAVEACLRFFEKK